jgi:large subunit ribosomal protein L13
LNHAVARQHRLLRRIGLRKALEQLTGMACNAGPWSLDPRFSRHAEAGAVCQISKTAIDRSCELAIRCWAFRYQAKKDGVFDEDFLCQSHEVQREWLLVDATDKVLGRLATEIARRLRGKHKPEFTPHVDTGDYIVVTNVEKLRVTGNKAEDKKYYRHSGYPGGIYETSFTKMQQRFPGRVLEQAVKGMLPKGPLGYAMLKKMKCYAGATHPHAAQQPKVLEL